MAGSSGQAAVRAHIIVSGRVQGVGFRAFAARIASKYGLAGGVRNLDDGRVEVDVEGEKTAIDALLQELRVGPPAASVSRVDTEWGGPTGRLSRFSIWY